MTLYDLVAATCCWNYVGRIMHIIVTFFHLLGVSKKLFLILRLSFGAVHFSMTKMLVLPDSRDMHKSFDT